MYIVLNPLIYGLASFSLFEQKELRVVKGDEVIRTAAVY